ncbi:MAG: hypothetical protein NZM35_01230 [Chitinophagales bacterium]|nr:hypothetical protein [Chitinophagales bacterium]MDW8418071.1 hypothetical protein [Chitinophagales bacterium]
MRRLAELLYRTGNLPFLITLFLLNAAFVLFILPAGLKEIENRAGKQVKLLDVQFGYDITQVRAILAEYTPEAIAQTLHFSAVTDTAFPISYGLLFVALLAYIFKDIPIKTPGFRYLYLYPLWIIAIDLAENYLIRNVLRSYPALQERDVALASAFTVIKWLSVAVFFIALLYGWWLRLKGNIGKQQDIKT